MVLLRCGSQVIWERRIRLVQLLGKTQAERPEIAEAIGRHLPDGRIADTLEWELPNIYSVRHFRPKAFSGDLRSIAILFRLGDNDELTEYVNLSARLTTSLIAIIGERAADGASDSPDILDRLIQLRGDVLDRGFGKLEYLFKAAAVALDHLTERQWFRSAQYPAVFRCLNQVTIGASLHLLSKSAIGQCFTIRDGHSRQLFEKAFSPQTIEVGSPRDLGI